MYSYNLYRVSGSELECGIGYALFDAHEEEVQVFTRLSGSDMSRVQDAPSCR